MIVFRVDASPTIGYGHLMRSLCLAKKYDDKEILFLSHDIDEKLVEKSGFKVVFLPDKSVEEFIFHIQLLKPKLLIIDSYRIQYKDEKKIKKSTGVELLVFDDTYKKHFADIVLNHNIYAKKSLYKDKVPSFCKLKCGKKHALIQENFIKEKKKKRKKEGILICLGGTDSKNLSLQIAKKIPQSLHVKIATTSSNKNLEELEEYARNSKNRTLYVNKNIAKLMNKSKFGIVTASTLSQEALFMKLPFIALQIASNQKYMSEYLNKKDITCKKILTTKAIQKDLKKHGITF